MKKTLIAFILALSLAGTAFAKDMVVRACTRNSRIVTLSVSLTDASDNSVMTDIAKAFVKAANSMTAEKLVSQEGFLAFRSLLSDEDYDAIVDMTAPKIGGSCAEAKK